MKLLTHLFVFLSIFLAISLAEPLPNVEAAQIYHLITRHVARSAERRQYLQSRHNPYADLDDILERRGGKKEEKPKCCSKSNFGMCTFAGAISPLCYNRPNCMLTHNCSECLLPFLSTVSFLSTVRYDKNGEGR